MSAVSCSKVGLIHLSWDASDIHEEAYYYYKSYNQANTGSSTIPYLSCGIGIARWKALDLITEITPGFYKGECAGWAERAEHAEHSASIEYDCVTRGILLRNENTEKIMFHILSLLIFGIFSIVVVCCCRVSRWAYVQLRRGHRARGVYRYQTTASDGHTDALLPGAAS